MTATMPIPSPAQRLGVEVADMLERLNPDTVPEVIEDFEAVVRTAVQWAYLALDDRGLSDESIRTVLGIPPD